MTFTLILAALAGLRPRSAGRHRDGLDATAFERKAGFHPVALAFEIVADVSVAELDQLLATITELSEVALEQ